MPRYRRKGAQAETSERDFLVRQVRAASAEMLGCAQTFYQGQTSGFPDIDGEQISGQARSSLETMTGMQARIADERLRELCSQIGDRLAGLVRLDTEAVEFVAGYLGRLPLDRNKLARYVESKRFAADYPSGPVWIGAPEYRRLRRRSLALFDDAWLRDQQIAARIRELVEAQGGEFEDVAAAAPVVRPIDQLREAIETIRQEIKDISARSERLTEIVTRTAEDLSTPIDKDSTPS